MGYLAFDGGVPDGAVETIIEVPASARRNQLAFIDAINSGGAYAYANTDIEGPADQPHTITYHQGSDILRLSLQWNADNNPSVITYDRSFDSGSSWTEIGVKTINYDADGNVEGFDWSGGDVAYNKLDPAVPDSVTQTGPEITPSIRTNQLAMADAVLMEGFVDWNFQLAAGSPSQPTQLLYTLRTNPDQLLKTTITWNADNNPETLKYERSYDGGGNWEEIGTKSITWSAGGAVLAITWQAPPP